MVGSRGHFVDTRKRYRYRCPGATENRPDTEAEDGPPDHQHGSQPVTEILPHPERCHPAHPSRVHHPSLQPVPSGDQRFGERHNRRHQSRDRFHPRHPRRSAGSQGDCRSGSPCGLHHRTLRGRRQGGSGRGGHGRRRPSRRPRRMPATGWTQSRFPSLTHATAPTSGWSRRCLPPQV